MLLFSHWPYLLLIPCLTAALIPNPPRSLLSLRQEEASLDSKLVSDNAFLYNGYHIHNCGNPTNQTSRAYHLLGFLSYMKPQLERIIADARQGRNSKHGYTAFFKTNVNIRKVVHIFESLVDAKPIIVSKERAKLTYQGSRTPQPMLQCTSEGDAASVVAWELCKSPNKMPIKAGPGTEVMAICPNFFKTSSTPASGPWWTRHYARPVDCPALSDGEFVFNDFALMGSMFAFVVYNLVVLNNREMYETYVDWDHLWDMQYAVDLNSRESMLNAASFGYYAGGEFWFVVECLAIVLTWL